MEKVLPNLSLSEKYLSILQDTQNPYDLDIETLQALIAYLGGEESMILPNQNNGLKLDFSEAERQTFVKNITTPGFSYKPELKQQIVDRLNSILGTKKTQQDITLQTGYDLVNTMHDNTEIQRSEDSYTQDYKAKIEIAKKISEFPGFEHAIEKNGLKCRYTTFFENGIVAYGDVHNVYVFKQDEDGTIRKLNEIPYKGFDTVGDYLIGSKSPQERGKGLQIVSADVYDSGGNFVLTTRGPVSSIHNALQNSQNIYYKESFGIHEKGSDFSYRTCLKSK